MDGPRSIPEPKPPVSPGVRAWAGVAVVTMMVVSAFLLGRCSAPDAAAAPAPQPVDLTYRSTPDVQLVDAMLVEHYLSTTTTTVAVQRPATRMTPPVMPGADRWDQLAQCETGQRWDANDGNGFGGGLQFAHQSGWSTWRAFGGTEFAADPWDASREQQIVVAERVLARSGWGAWPGCARREGWL